MLQKRSSSSRASIVVINDRRRCVYYTMKFIAKWSVKWGGRKKARARDQKNEVMHQITYTSPTKPMLGIGSPDAESAKSGTASPIVAFRQSRRAVSMPDGSGGGVVSLPASASVLLYPSSVSETLLARKYCTACSGSGSVALPLNGADAVEELAATVQFMRTDAMSETTVVLSATMWNVVLVVFEENAACAMAPPGRLELFGSPYCEGGRCVGELGRLLPGTRLTRLCRSCAWDPPRDCRAGTRRHTPVHRPRRGARTRRGSRGLLPRAPLCQDIHCRSSYTVTTVGQHRYAAPPMIAMWIRTCSRKPNRASRLPRYGLQKAVLGG